MRKKRYFVGIFCLILLIIFFVFYYKNFRNGNNIISKSEIVEYILNDLNEYEATVEIMVISNKNENTYKMWQKVTKELSAQEVLEPENIKGLKIELDGKNLRVYNTVLQMEKVYSDYNALLNNSLFLNVFISDYKANVSSNYEEDGKMIFETKLDGNASTYVKYKKLYVDSVTGKPIKLEIKDNTQKTRLCILYNDIEIN